MPSVSLSSLYQRCAPGAGILVMLDSQAESIRQRLHANNVSTGSSHTYRHRDIVSLKRTASIEDDELQYIHLPDATFNTHKVVQDLIYDKYPVIVMFKRVSSGIPDTYVGLYDKRRGYTLEDYGFFHANYFQAEYVEGILHASMQGNTHQIQRAYEEYEQRTSVRHQHIYWHGQEALYKLDRLHELVKPQAAPKPAEGPLTIPSPLFKAYK